ncbi:hypothetical protein CDO73_10400 [Saccharibacillus sp. O23]|uniref:hypothetical protein n=1 Tax=Saccharibacillus sp. O23 TaxID=2009338 RepID=UPI000B4E3D7C|nr:hypothetical protein [Saccharibacillus sp. O23]OWR30327.1 hypothetical protein CDO73_10400 [Saccharibacillus sp. O23]
MDNRYNSYDTDRSRDVYPAVPGYWDYLKYHLLLYVLPWAVATILMFGQLRYLIELMSYGFAVMAGGWESISEDRILEIGTNVLRLIGFFAIFGLIIALLSAGLRFLPTLGRSGRLRLGQVIRTGLRYFFPTFFAMLLVSLVIGTASSILSFIPLLGFVMTVVSAYVNALASIYYDYWFSYNEAAGRPVYSGPIDRLRALYGKDGEFWVYALLLMLSYFVLASSFVKPYIQMKMTQKMGMTERSRGW